MREEEACQRWDHLRAMNALPRVRSGGPSGQAADMREGALEGEAWEVALNSPRCLWSSRR
jgi:hypothetical protein